MRKPVLKEVGPHAILYVMASDDAYGASLKRRIMPLVMGGGAVEAAVVLSATLARLEADGNAPSLVVSLGTASSSSLEQDRIYQVAPVSDPPIGLRMPLAIPGIPGAALSNADMVDEQTFAIARACAFHRVPLVALRGISSGAVGERRDDGQYLRIIDERLAEAIDHLETALAEGHVAPIG